jgi:hypothetical protein
MRCKGPVIFADLKRALCRADQFFFIDYQPELEFQALSSVS